MAMCAVCNRSITAKQIKITCCDCEKDFHGSCVKVSKADIEYQTGAGIVWRCDPCNEARRRSMSFEDEASDGKLTLNDILKAIQELTSEHKSSVKDFNTSYEVLNDKLNENTLLLKEQTTKITEYMVKIDQLSIENKILKDRIQVLEDKLDETDQYSRRNCVEIQGVPVKDNDVMQAVKDVGSALGFDIQDTMIDACHTLGKKPNSKDPPGIMVKFVRRMDADTLLAKRRVKKDLSTRHLNLPTDSPVYLNESLTPMRRKLLAMARDEKRKQGYKWLWVRRGNIFLRKVDNGPVILIKSLSDLGKV
ncbi:uncharacterized protein LOC124363496 [Homalodisca vitripennis]|uniref:uncharacterized protein LOC124363496 n=1 Tax=Homalodisca vitripennis TaxID=197043 RepID=UPI001EECE817|nr:uncharacterized protein LOC124363496 [Homalodisca vitripennis]